LCGRQRRDLPRSAPLTGLVSQRRCLWSEHRDALFRYVVPQGSAPMRRSGRAARRRSRPWLGSPARRDGGGSAASARRPDVEAAVRLRCRAEDLRGGVGPGDLETPELDSRTDDLGRPAALAGRGDESVARGGNVASRPACEEVQVVGVALDQILRDECTTAGEQEADRLRQGEGDAGELDLELAQPRPRGGRSRRSVRTRAIRRAHASRSGRGRTRSSHRSTRRAPSM